MYYAAGHTQSARSDDFDRQVSKVAVPVTLDLAELPPVREVDATQRERGLAATHCPSARTLAPGEAAREFPTFV